MKNKLRLLIWQLFFVVTFLLLCTNAIALTVETTSPGAITLSGINTDYVSTERVEVIGIFFWPAAAAQNAIVRCNTVTGPRIFQSQPVSLTAQYMPLPGLKCKPVVVVAEGTYDAGSYITIFKKY